MVVPPAPSLDEEATNDERASWAEVGLTSYGIRTGTVRTLVGDDEDPFLIISDCLADLAHRCDRHQVDLQAAIQQATKHYQAETSFEGMQLL
jgi:hypothetical protein